MTYNNKNWEDDTYNIKPEEWQIQVGEAAAVGDAAEVIQGHVDLELGAHVQGKSWLGLDPESGSNALVKVT